MKNFQQNLFITLALGLCGLCAWQWYAQTIQRMTIGQLNQMVYDRNASIQNYTNSIATLNGQVAEMDARITEFKSTVATNEQIMTSQKAQIAQLQFDNDTYTNEITQYKVALDTLESRLKDANDNIDKQNTVITNLLSQRNDLVTKYDELATNRNDIVLKYNALMGQKKSQADKNGQ
jgi:chromosome segregation ATPase